MSRVYLDLFQDLNFNNRNSPSLSLMKNNFDLRRPYPDADLPILFDLHISVIRQL